MPIAQRAHSVVGHVLPGFQAALRSHFLGKKPGVDPMRARFARYDINGDGELGKEEVSLMILECGFNVDEGYVDGALGVFGQFDGDGSHCRWAVNLLQLSLPCGPTIGRGEWVSAC